MTIIALFDLGGKIAGRWERLADRFCADLRPGHFPLTRKQVWRWRGRS